MITIIDYGLGNLASITNAFDRLSLPSIISNRPNQILKATGLILPGVGAAGAGMQNLKKTGLDQIIIRFAKTGKPILGICLGMQLLFSQSQEGNVSCLNLISGTVKKFTSKNLKIPQIGWNQVNIINSSRLLNQAPNNSYAYFVNSYYCAPRQKSAVIATTTYGQSFASVIEQNNLFATQFHPEKSGDFGNIILKNFGGLC